MGFYSGNPPKAAGLLSERGQYYSESQADNTQDDKDAQDGHAHLPPELSYEPSYHPREEVDKDKKGDE